MTVLIREQTCPEAPWNAAGGHRMLGVRTGTAPEKVSDLLGEDPWSTDVYGDLEVCPFTQDKPGHMQMVCIESAAQLSARPRK
jgi:hypothetical protein